MKYRKKPVEIEAVQHTGDNYWEISNFMGSNVDGTLPFRVDGDDIFIKTLEGELKADINDYIIKGVKGEFYPCKPDIFKATYEPVEQSHD